MDYDVEALSLASPPASAPQQTYTPAIRVRNNGIHQAIASGYVRAFVAGVQVYFSPVQSPLLDPGEEGEAVASIDWTPDTQGPAIVDGYVSTAKDQRKQNNPLAPVQIVIGPPPPPPEPATLDDVVAALAPLALDTTVDAVAEKLPSEPALNPTSEEIRDKLPAAPATEPTLQLVKGLLDNPLTVIAGADFPTTSLPATTYQANGLAIIGTTPQQIVFASPTKSVLIQSLRENSGTVYIGDDLVNQAGFHALAALQAGDSIAIDVDATVSPLRLVATQPAQQVITSALLQ